MASGILLLLGFLADSRSEADRVALEKAEFAAYQECTSARSPTKVLKVDVEDVWLRAGEAPDAPTKGVLHRGQAVTLLKRTGSGNLLVKTEENRKGFLWSDEVVEEVQPPRDPRPVDECPVPGFFREFHHPRLMFPLPETRPGPGPEDLDSLELRETPP